MLPPSVFASLPWSSRKYIPLSVSPITVPPQANNMGDDYELPHNSSALKIPEQNLSGQRGSVDRDDADLMRLGKKPVLKVSARLNSSYCPSD